MEGYKELLGIWIGEHEGASFWAQVLTELNNRGVFHQSDIQLCIVHLVRNSLEYV